MRKVVPKEQRDELLRRHLAKDRDGARALAVELGLSPNYAATLAGRLKYKPLYRPVPTQHKWVEP